MVQVRNHILARWRADVTRYLSVESACSKIQPRYYRLAQQAWHVLNLNGLINFGVAPDVLHDPIPRSPSSPRKSIIIIGAGLAGLFTRSLHCIRMETWKG
jgi:lysine-specific histone demethylase 1